ncbi:hypothetical protein LOK49_LG11G00684 [Camellia lanceoleosa]|uniref:Uncharacterized protein n=1 Tax=Camellia lanceoleosa TaxID=1840588 RepID=A0ACC0G2J7_9ERIC|nr:hypothetical protein LOK49_LG11G00684 [Camellia lanceoleosa]
MYSGLLCVEPSGGNSLSKKVKVGEAPPWKTSPTNCSGVVKHDDLPLSSGLKTHSQCIIPIQIIQPSPTGIQAGPFSRSKGGQTSPNHKTLLIYNKEGSKSELFCAQIGPSLALEASTSSGRGRNPDSVPKATCPSSPKWSWLGSLGTIGEGSPKLSNRFICGILNLSGNVTTESVYMPCCCMIDHCICAFHKNVNFERIELLMTLLLHFLVKNNKILIEKIKKTRKKKYCIYLLLSLSLSPILYLSLKCRPRTQNFSLRITFVLDEEMSGDDECRETLQGITNNGKLSEGYLMLARDIEVMEPKSLKDIYKAHLLHGRASADLSVNSASQNLAVTFVNAFINAGFVSLSQDKLMTVPFEASSGGSSGNWVFKNKAHEKASAAGSMDYHFHALWGMILLWDVDSGLAQIDKYLHSDDKNVIAGALLGVGILPCGVEHECDPALSLLADYVDKEDFSIKIGAIMGLGLAYAGAQCPQVRFLAYFSSFFPFFFLLFFFRSFWHYLEAYENNTIRSKLSCVLEDKKMPLDVIVFTAISLGLVYESVEETVEISRTLNTKIRKHCHMILFSCVYAGTADVHEVPVVLGIAMVAMAEELGLEMAIHSLEHLLQYGEQNIRKAVPLALGLLCISNPKVNVTETLSRLSHNTDIEIATAAVISLGLIGSGTKNARIAGMLHNLSSYYYKEPRLLFYVSVMRLFSFGSRLVLRSFRLMLDGLLDANQYPEQIIAALVTSGVPAFLRQQRHCFGVASPGEFPLSASPSIVLHVLTACNLDPHDLASLEATCSFFKTPGCLDHESSLSELAALDMCQKRAIFKPMTADERQYLKARCGGSWKLVLRFLQAGEVCSRREKSQAIAGPGHSIAVTSNGVVYSFGSNSSGQLGHARENCITYREQEFRERNGKSH